MNQISDFVVGDKVFINKTSPSSWLHGYWGTVTEVVSDVSVRIQGRMPEVMPNSKGEGYIGRKKARGFYPGSLTMLETAPNRSLIHLLKKE